MTASGGSAWSDEVARYYDRNTRRFLIVGRDRGVHAMHRELWGPGVDTANGAADHVNHLLADEIAELAPGGAPVILDFGCGVGGTLFHLARRFPEARSTGVTVSSRQVEMAGRLAAELGLESRCSFVQADFQDARLATRADVVVAVESFAHAESADAFLAGVARHLEPGGHLVLVDDFLASDHATLDARRRRNVEHFRVGWRVPAVCTLERFAEAGRRHGFDVVKSTDLTALVRPGSRTRDRLVAVVGPLAARLGLARVPFYGNMVGGYALQIGLREGFLCHRIVVARRTA